MFILGDVHGQLDLMRRHLKKISADELVIQIGDLGIGFPKGQSENFPKRFKFIVGNHDNPEVAKKHPNYMGDFGCEEIEGHKIFWVGGAWSIDQNRRIEGRDWWREEELSVVDLGKAFDLYYDYKPDIMITHDGPVSATRALMNRYALGNWDYTKEPFPTRTGQALSSMFEAYKPKSWFFGHWHTSWHKLIQGTEFRCINELEFYKVE